MNRKTSTQTGPAPTHSLFNICLFSDTVGGKGVLLEILHRKYNISRLFRIVAHAELFGIFHLFTLILEEFDYTARVQHALVAIERK